MGLTGSVNPNELTTDDVVRWCHELADSIARHPDQCDLWMAWSSDLQRKITAIATIRNLCMQRNRIDDAIAKIEAVRPRHTPGA